VLLALAPVLVLLALAPVLLALVPVVRADNHST
jgi:hypothetical protein